MERGLFQDFEGQQYLSPDLRYWTEFWGAGNIEFAEDLLLTRKLFLTTHSQIGQETRVRPFKAVASMNKKPLKKAIPINLFGTDGLEILSTDAIGSFTIPDEKMVMDDEKTVAVFATGYLATIVDVNIDDPYQFINTSISKNLQIRDRIQIKLQTTKEAYIVDPNANKIEMVTISLNNSSNIGSAKRRVNACGDYVCKYNFLNCPMLGHNQDTMLPEQGKKYFHYPSGPSSPMESIVYDGCVGLDNKSVHRFSGFNMPSDFYFYDKAELDRGAPLFSSTLYWSPETLLQKSKTENIGFHIGDVPGRYTIIVQGISNKGFVYAETGFDVVE